MSRLHAACCALLLLGAALTGCSDEDGSGTADQSSSSTTEAVVRPLRLPTAVTRVHGDLTKEQRRRVAVGAKEVITGYLEAAYLHQRPGSGYRGSFPGFTLGARALALKDTAVVSDRSFDGSTVKPRGGVAYVSVVAPHGHPVGATARVSVDLAVADSQRTKWVTVTGRLLLTPRTNKWRIFGYDLALEPTTRGKS
jgi:hypothetical protein